MDDSYHKIADFFENNKNEALYQIVEDEAAENAGGTGFFTVVRPVEDFLTGNNVGYVEVWESMGQLDRLLNERSGRACGLFGCSLFF